MSTTPEKTRSSARPPASAPTSCWSPITAGAVQARGYWELVWRRFKRDRVALGSIVFLVFLVLVCYPGAWLAERLVGHGPSDQFSEGVDDGIIPVGPWTKVYNPFTGEEQLLVLGASDTLGRDEFLRLLYGGRVSLQVALLATIGVVLMGSVLGAVAGYYRGWADTVISRLTEITMAFPALLFMIALASTVGSRLDNVTLGGFVSRGVVTLVLVFWAFGWFYPGPDHPGQGALAAREGVRRGGADDRCERLARHPVSPAAAPRRADHRLLDPGRAELRPRRGGALLPRRGHPAARRRAGATCSRRRRSSTPRSRG